MKKIALTVAVLALGLAACAQNNDDANNVAANDLTIENEAADDMNLATEENAAGNALDAASNAIDNATDAVENAGEAVENAADNATN